MLLSVQLAEFGLFGLTLAGVIVLHRHALACAVTGLLAIVATKLVWGTFATGPGVLGLVHHLGHETPTLLNLLGLLLGFAVLAKHFELSQAPDVLPRWLPDSWWGGVVLLAFVFVLSAFLDNIAGAMIGAVIAKEVYSQRVHIGFLAAVVAASNAGGAGSVLGDTTTTMLWIAGVPASEVARAMLGSVVAFAVFAPVAARTQHRFQPMLHDPPPGLVIDLGRLAIVGLVLVGAVATNLWMAMPAVGVWVALLAGSLWRKTPWVEVRGALAGALFLLALVTAASLMPVDHLPSPVWHTAFGLGLLSAVFDNIPLTKLALDQGGYDWGFVAYAVGFGGSLLWFGSSAGVAVANAFAEAKDTRQWLRHGWPIALGYVAGFAAMLLGLGWRPGSP